MTLLSCTQKSLEQTINDELAKISDWLLANKLSLNLKKSNFVIFRPYQKKLPFIPRIKIFDVTTKSYTLLEMKNYVRYLGILIDSNLSWKEHINLVCQKVSKCTGIIARLRHFIPVNSLIKIYNALIYPYLQYGICAWGFAAATHLNKALVIQKCAMRLIYFKMPREHAIPLFSQAKALPISFIHFRQLCKLMWDISHDLAPTDICNNFSKISDIHGHRTRSATKSNFYIERSSTKVFQKSCQKLEADIWNSIPLHLRKLSKSTLNKKITDSLHQLLVTIDDYVEVSEISHAIKKLYQ